MFLSKLFPKTLWQKPTIGYAGVLLFKFLFFDFIWCLNTTFTSFSIPELYVNSILASLVLLFPFIITRNHKLQFVVNLLIDILLVCNLMYSRTYNSAIPLESYGLAGNLSDFIPSVIDSTRFVDIVFPISTLVAFFLLRKVKTTRGIGRPYAATLLVIALISGIQIALKGGLDAAYKDSQGANRYICLVPMYTVFGNLAHNAMEKDIPLTPKMKQEVEQWLHNRPPYKPLSDSIPAKQNIVIILCESLESWPLQQKVEGKEITPNLNKALAAPGTIYAPHVLTQVKGGRSIDGQLLLNAGMLPLMNGCYAFDYTGNNFMTLTKALHEREKSRSYLLTVDKPITWNQAMVAKAFGIDTIISKNSWVLDEKVGSRKKLGDVSFMKQAVGKMQRDEVWKPGEKVYLQLVTYSGHNPFVLPDKLKRIHLKGSYPQKMADYITMANYTDHAIGILLDYLKTRPDYKNTLIFITGDHEGLAADRADILKTVIGRKYVSAHQYTPFIVLNSNITLRYDKVMGQVDIYPTLLNLMHLDNYPWKGMGQSILDPQKQPAAVGSTLDAEAEGRVSQKEIKHLKEAHYISDIILRYNLLDKRHKI